jgi:hypothetical protein
MGQGTCARAQAALAGAVGSTARRPLHSSPTEEQRMKADSRFLFPLQDLFEQAFRNFTITPLTDWKRFYNPQFFFSYNAGDVDLENHVLSEAGSYGRQLGIVLKVLDLLLARVPESQLQQLTPQEVVAREEFRDLLRTVRAAKAEFRGRADAGLTRDDIDDLIDRLRALEHTDKATYRALVEHLRAALGTDGQ